MGYTESLNALINNPVIANLKSTNATEAMTISLDWAYNQAASGEVPPPFANAMQLADEYRIQYPSLTEASNNLIKYELPKISGVGLLTSLWGTVSLPVNVAAVLFMQIRLVQAIAHLAGRDSDDEEVKALTFASLLGSQGVSLVKKQMLKEGLPKLLPQIVAKLAPKMLGTKSISKLIPIVSGVIGTSIDTLTTYGILKTAQGLFLGDIMQQEALTNMQEQRIRLLINMAHVDNELAEEEKELILQMINDSDFSEDKKQELASTISETTPLKIDFSPFKEERVYAINIMTSLVSVMNADGKIHLSEKLYLMEIAKELNISKDEIEIIIDSCNP